MKLKLILRTFRLIRECDRSGFLWLVVLSVFSALLPLANLTVLKKLVDVGLEQRDFSQVLIYIIAFAVLFLASRCVNIYYSAKQEILGQKFVDFTNNLVHRQSSQMDLSYYDSADNHDRLYRAQQEAGLRPLHLMTNSISLFQSAISILGIVAILAGNSLWAVFVLFVTVMPSFAVRLVKSRKLYQFNRDMTMPMRRSRYLSSLVTSRNYAMEVKSRGLSEYFCDKYVEIRDTLRLKIRRIVWQMTSYDTLCSLFEALSVLAVTMILVKETVGGVYSIGTFVMLFEAFRRGQSYFSSMTQSLAGVYDNLLFIGNLFDFMDIRPRIVSPGKPEEFPGDIESVVFDDVSFSYPGSGTPVLEHFRLSAHKGEITRIEGPNGFGKTTIVKLLLRMYDPALGAILINGTDIKRFRLEDLRRNVSAAFQELNIFNFSIRDNIRFGDMSLEDESEERISESVRLSESSSIIDSYPEGIGTMVGREFDNGVEPSMGQRQRLCLARHFYSNAPIMVFDEPTAWMDSASRSAFMHHLEELSRDKLIIFISHIQ